jgi:putative transposase
MPRRRRVHIDGLPLHIVQRGHNREPCFFAKADFLAYLGWLDDALHDTDCALHAYVLMTNHVHLLLTPACAALVPKLLIALGRRYVQYVNKTYRRTGTLWDSRYKSSLVDADGYLLACMRYIELNPVRAAMVHDPASYRWSSYRANGRGHRDGLLTPHPLYLQLGSTDADRRVAYRSLFCVQPGGHAIDDVRLALNRDQPLGSERFHVRVEHMLGRRCFARPRGRPRRAADDPAEN